MSGVFAVGAVGRCLDIFLAYHPSLSLSLCRFLILSLSL